MNENKKLTPLLTYDKPTLKDYADKIMHDDKFGQVEEITINNKTKTIKATFNNGENRIVQTVTVNPIGTVGTTTNYPTYMSKSQLREAIKELRDQNYTQVEIADTLGKSQSYISQLEND